MTFDPADAGPVVLFYVQHLRGVGHAFRAARVGRALAARGARVHLVWGGSRLPSIDLSGLDVTWLDPVKVGDDSYSELVDLAGRPVDQAFREDRCAMLLDLFERTRP
ncbi:MAG: glycosyl transferase, partial [Pseudomonadota bacterium]|nr:glycosyl transferase [Pseudomonadota bacterium]